MNMESRAEMDIVEAIHACDRATSRWARARLIGRKHDLICRDDVVAACRRVVELADSEQQQKEGK